ncbi:hypothetical protein BG011_008612 [Mortierella polycephala]|uniref:D-aminoacid aminotransferase-like PLP-dependent enzyme n=1 Tax=Mortierella polycephala TaxID=41804 RepID=A0A9P6QAK0_9FUNG|nr:hypothetical protein BG011_008612 [Mortierella polycephala]
MSPVHVRDSSMQPGYVLATRNHSHRAVMEAEAHVTVSWTDVGANDMLLAYPSGAYTAMRTFGHRGIMDFSGHVARLASSVAQIHFSESEQDRSKEDVAVETRLTTFRNPETLYTEMKELVRSALMVYYGRYTESGEAKVTVLCTWDVNISEPIFIAHIEPLKVPKEPRCKVLVQGSPRHHATAKDSQWVRDRSILEAELSKDMNEALLLDDATQELYEGLSSNFFAWDRIRQTIITAPLDSVLEGTILKVVVAVCKQQKIPVEFKFPTLKSINDWDGAFITSTSRLVLPIKTMVLPDGSQKSFGESETIELIRTLVLQECKKRVETLLTAQEIDE